MSGTKCSMCGAFGATKTTCPLNPKALKPVAKNHNPVQEGGVMAGNVNEFIRHCEDDFEVRFGQDDKNRIIEFFNFIVAGRATINIDAFIQICCVMYPIADENSHPILYADALSVAGFPMSRALMELIPNLDR